MSNKIRVALIDDDEAVLDSLRLYLGMKGFDVQCFVCAEELLKKLSEGLAVDCIVSDVRLPGLSGLDLQRELSVRRSPTPLILITAHGDIAMAVSAIKAGAHEFIEKPFEEEQLVTTINDAVTRADRQQTGERELQGLAARVAELSERQRQVMSLTVRGLTNKEIAAELQISPRTVETYRAWVMQRIGAKNIAELVRIATRLESIPPVKLSIPHK